ncbi:hypothetical protein CH330_04810 [candidate division WOR-3 bacterium JGI_Cruoil_03_51_56]|uniref:Glycosyltransferase RgtA/B/C/D-like domain-containing protein n=1 Tax=candidate division WOR-3 bacterium JGI_Cruoil_03_51_56 TaxID=1973747 RepID=A0A235BU51_UNCW3|nr:MAG: hypothetical protein CH330_04810 [candidate division WOR-3 bacterium JGI_Cruoil_03_51_56]
MTSTERLLIVIAVAVGVTVRILMTALPAVPLRTKGVKAISDAAEYEKLALNLAHNRVFSRDTAPPFRPELFRTPVYPLFLIPFCAIHWNTTLAIIIAQLLLSLLLIWVIRRLALELNLDRKTAAIATLFLAASPNLAFLSTKMVTETVFTLLLAVCLLLFNRFRQSLKTRDLIVAAICSGLLILTRPIAILFPLVLTGYLIFYLFRNRRIRWYHPAIPVLCALIVVLPWVIRNGKLTGRYIISTAGEHNLFLYNAATVIAAERGINLSAARDTMRKEAAETFGSFDSTDKARFWQRLAIIARSHIMRYPLLAAKVQFLGFIANFVSPISIQPLMIHSGIALPQQPHVFQQAVGLLTKGRIAAAAHLAWTERLSHLGIFAWVVLVVSTVFQLMLLVFCFIGLFTKPSRGLLWLLLPVCYFTILTGPVGEARFRAPIEPVLVLFAAVGLTAVVTCLPKERKPSSQDTSDSP